ncbi:MAG TPA: phosphatase PAP2 family protein [Blastocatellia bacterium]|nr:phosphatase PAP2 family protein [Blastocatellia bacterium]
MKPRDFFARHRTKGPLTAFAKYLGRTFTPAILIYWMILLVCLFVFANLADDVYERETFGFDKMILTFCANYQNQLLTGFFMLMSWLGSGYSMAISTLIGMGLLFKRRHYADSLLLGFGVGGAALFTHLLKPFITRHRPNLFPSLVELPTNYSFPSGHATQSAAFALCLYLIAAHHKAEWKVPVAIIAFSFAFCVGLSRVYLQVHFPSDVLGGFTLSIAWVLGLSALLKWRRRQVREGEMRG